MSLYEINVILTFKLVVNMFHFSIKYFIFLVLKSKGNLLFSSVRTGTDILFPEHFSVIVIF